MELKVFSVLLKLTQAEKQLGFLLQLLVLLERQLKILININRE